MAVIDRAMKREDTHLEGPIALEGLLGSLSEPRRLHEVVVAEDDPDGRVGPPQRHLFSPLPSASRIIRQPAAFSRDGSMSAANRLGDPQVGPVWMLLHMSPEICDQLRGERSAAATVGAIAAGSCLEDYLGMSMVKGADRCRRRKGDAVSLGDHPRNPLPGQLVLRAQFRHLGGITLVGRQFRTSRDRVLRPFLPADLGRRRGTGPLLA